MLASTALAVPAGAEDISIPFDELVFGQPGSVVTIATVDVDQEMVGRTCHLSVLAENQASVHPGNDLIVSTGNSQAVIFGVEDTANGGTTETYEMVVGSTILVQLRIGQDGMSSLGFDLSFDCTDPIGSAPPASLINQQLTTTTTAPTTTAAPTTTVAPATTTVPPTTAPPETTTTAAPTTTAPGEVAGSSANQLPETPAAEAVAGAPSYTG